MLLIENVFTKKIIIPRENVRGKKEFVSEWLKWVTEIEMVKYSNSSEFLQALITSVAVDTARCIKDDYCVLMYLPLTLGTGKESHLD